MLIFKSDAVRTETVISGYENAKTYIITSMKYVLVIKHVLLLRDKYFQDPCGTPVRCGQTLTGVFILPAGLLPITALEMVESWLLQARVK